MDNDMQIDMLTAVIGALCRGIFDSCRIWGGILHCSILGSSGEKLGMYSDFYSLDLSRDYAGTHGCVKLCEYVFKGIIKEG